MEVMRTDSNGHCAAAFRALEELHQSGFVQERLSVLFQEIAVAVSMVHQTCNAQFRMP